MSQKDAKKSRGSLPSGLVGTVATSRGGVTSLAATSTYDKLNRLDSISSGNALGTVSSHHYGYNDLNQRTEALLDDSSKWVYDYDAMGQVTAGTKRWTDQQPVPGARFGYAYDGIGNRTSATRNGRQSFYEANLANQYIGRQVPGFIDVFGTAAADAKVTVNLGPTQRRGDYFYRALDVDNDAAPQFHEVAVSAVRNDVGPGGEDLQAVSTGNVYLAKNPEVFTYDDEGNLTSDGRWTYTWDGENRLIVQQTVAAVPGPAMRRLEFAYDAESRRVRKRVYVWTGTAWTLSSDRRFLYDGWNLAAELDATNTLVRSYVWGPDLSRSLQGAGGVGGLLSIRDGSESHHPAYDGNGNVMALVRASDRATTARYEYGPFGETLVVHESGVTNPFRFSTKYRDGESGLYYYGYRYLNPETGRWLNRDPIEESGGVNLYGFLGNDGLNEIDVLGLRGRRGTPPNPGFFDQQGWEIFYHWLYGGGVPFTKGNSDADWRNYMMSNELLSEQLRTIMEADALRQSRRMSKEEARILNQDVAMQNGYRTGYELLHRTTRFHIRGPAPRVVPGPSGTCKVTYSRLNFVWIDDIDHNPQYPLDTLLDQVFREIGWTSGLYNATDYPISIFWSSGKAEVNLRNGIVESATGYPFENE